MLMSLLVPGFGLVRVGRIRRGITWLIGLPVGGTLALLLLAWESVPIAIGIGAAACFVIAVIWMLCDSFRPGRMTPKLWGALAALLALISLLPVPERFVVKTFKVAGGAMEPTLMGKRNGEPPDHVFANSLSYLIAKPKRGDIVTFSTSAIPGLSHLRAEEEIFYVMRIVGLPGERIEIFAGSVYADGVRLDHRHGIPPIDYVIFPNLASAAIMENGDYVVGPDEYFVLGDNSRHSADSRFWGCVPASSIFGKVSRIYFPFSRIGAPRFPRR